MLLLFGSLGVSAQSGFFVPQAGKIYFGGDSSTIFSNVINKGRLGVGRNAVVNFAARQWENDQQASMPDETGGTNGVGGWVRFLSDSMRQQVIGGYNAASKTGASFPNIIIQNRYGITLLDGSAKVRRSVQFNKGNVYLQDQVMVVGDQQPGYILGYDSTRFFVTGNASNTGLLIREFIQPGDGIVVFPVGSHDNSYTPAAIRSRNGLGDDYYVSVFDSVKSGLTAGSSLSRESVGKTWQVGKLLHPGAGDVEVILQHRLRDEGDHFAANRQYTYVSQYNNGNWDAGFPQNYPVPGYFGFGRPSSADGTNARVFHTTVSNSSFFSKFTGDGLYNIKTNLFFNAYRLNRDMVRVYWNTKPEVNIKYFIVQRRLSTEAVFKNVDTVSSQAINGYSMIDLAYSDDDPNSYTGISYYRLKAVAYGNGGFYSITVPVGGEAGLLNIVLWPNPTPDVFHISIPLAIRAKAVVVWNVIGQKLREEAVNGRTIISMRGFIPGTYLVGVVLEDGKILETKKLLVR